MKGKKYIECDLCCGLGYYLDMDGEYITCSRCKGTGKLSIVKQSKSTGKDGKRGKTPAGHCSPSTVNSRPTLKPIAKLHKPLDNSNFEYMNANRDKINELCDRINLLSKKI